MTKSRDPRLDSDEDYIHAPKYNDSIDKFVDENPDGASSQTVATLLQLKISEVEKVYGFALQKLRDLIGL